MGRSHSAPLLKEGMKSISMIFHMQPPSPSPLKVYLAHIHIDSELELQILVSLLGHLSSNSILPHLWGNE